MSGDLVATKLIEAGLAPGAVPRVRRLIDEVPGEGDAAVDAKVASLRGEFPALFTSSKDRAKERFEQHRNRGGVTRG